MIIVENEKDFFTGLDNHVVKIDVAFGKRVKRILEFAMKSLTAKTPVHSGTAVRNYVASMWRPYSGVELPGIGTGPIEPTNQLPLGAESRRPENTDDAFATLKNINNSRNPYVKYFITNRARNISGLEHGELPEPPFTPRSPLGMFGVTLQELITLLESGYFK